MKKILAFAGSNSPRSINHQLVSYASSILNETSSTLISLRDFDMPLFGIEPLEKDGAPERAYKLRELITEHDAFIISISEHNKSVSSVFKNAMDWISKAGPDYNVFDRKPVLLLGAAPGPGGARIAITHAADIIDELKGRVTDQFSFPFFYKNAQLNENGFQITGSRINEELHQLIENFESRLQEEIMNVSK